MIMKTLLEDLNKSQELLMQIKSFKNLKHKD